VAARVIAPGFPARGVAHGGAPADGATENSRTAGAKN
jgi:hypothetical protein